MEEFGMNSVISYKGFSIASYIVDTEIKEKSTFYVVYGEVNMDNADEKYLLSTGEVVKWQDFSNLRENDVVSTKELLEFHIGLTNTKATIDKFIEENPEYVI